jgi:hypothetical protein
MKLASASMALVLAIAAPVAAQTRVEVGVIGGVNLGDAEIDAEDLDPDLFERRAQPLFGGIIKIGGTRAAVRTGVLYLRKGAELTPSPDITSKFTLTYLEVPVHVILNLGSGPVQPYIVAGPSFGYLLDAKTETEGSEDDIKENLEDADVSLEGGIGINFNLDQGSFFVEGRYSHGVYNISSTPTEVVIKNRGIHLVGGFTVRLGG